MYEMFLLLIITSETLNNTSTYKPIQICINHNLNHSAGKRDRDPNPPPVACSKVAEGGREL